MKTLFKIVLSLILLLVVAIGAAIVLAPKYLDPNQFKSQITAQVEKATGRKLTLVGDIKMTYYPWLGGSIGQMSLANAAGFGDTPMVNANKAAVRVQLLPLLTKRALVTDTIQLEGAQIHLIKNADGKTNYADLLVGGDDKSSSSVQLGGMSFNGLSITDSSFTWDDQQKGEKYTLQQLNIRAGELSFLSGVPLELSTQFIAHKQALAGAIKFDGNVKADFGARAFQISDVKIIGAAKGAQIPGGQSDIKLDAGDIKLDLTNGAAEIENLIAAAFGANVTASIKAANLLAGAPVASGSLAVNAENATTLINTLLKKNFKNAGALKLDADFALDAASGNLALTTLDLTALNSHISGKDVKIARLATPAQAAASGSLKVDSKDVAALLAAVAPGKLKLSGPLKLNTAFQVDLQADTAKFENLDLNVMSSSIKGNIDAKRLRQGSPAASGNLLVDSKNGPALISALTGKAAKGNAPLKLRTGFAADLQAGVLKLSALDLNTVGTTITGSMDGKGDAVGGQLKINSADVNALLSAYGFPTPAVSVSSLAAAATISGSAQHMVLNPITLTANAKGGSIPGGGTQIKLNTQADVNLGKDVITLNNMNLQGLGLDLKGNVAASGLKTAAPKLAGSINIAPFNLRAFLGNLGTKLPPMADANTLTRFALDSQIAGSPSNIQLTKMKMTLDDSVINGDLAVSNFSQPAFAFNLNLNGINADRYMAPRSDAAVASDQKTGVAAGPAGAAAVAASTELPLESLRKLNLNGSASIGKMILRNAKLANVRATVNARDGDINVNPVSANLYEGTYSGAVALNAQGKAASLRINNQLKGISVEPLLTDLKGKSKLRGKGDFSLAATATGATTLGLKQTLNGNGAFAFYNGALKGYNIGRFIRKAQVGFIGQYEKNEETDFSELLGSFRIVNGVVQNDDLAAKSPLLRVDGKGQANLVNETVNYMIGATLVASSEGQGAADVLDLGGTRVPVKISGTFDNLKFAPDLSGVVFGVGKKLLQTPGKTVDAVIGEGLGKVLGVPQQTAPAPAAPAPADPAAPAPAPKKPEEQLQDAVKDIFKF